MTTYQIHTKIYYFLLMALGKRKKMWRRVEERSILKSRSQRLLFEVSWMLSRHIKWIYRTCRFSLDSYWSPWEMAVWLTISCGINTYIITSVLMNRSLAQNSVNECYSVSQRSVLSKRATLKGNNLEKKRVAFSVDSILWTMQHKNILMHYWYLFS